MPEITITNPHPVLRPLRPEGSPEYQKDYKPENNSGCGFKGKSRAEVLAGTSSNRVVRRGCCIRYTID